MGIKIDHRESDLSSYDRTMPKEINRVLVDYFSDSYFVTKPNGMVHIKKENRSSKACYVGNTMITFDIDAINKLIDDIVFGIYKKGELPKLLNGNATERIV